MQDPMQAPQVTVAAVAEFLGTTTDEVMDAIRREEVKFEPSLGELGPQSLIYRAAVDELRFSLGFVTADEAAQFEQRAKSRRKQTAINRVLLVIAGFYLIIFVGFLAGFGTWRGRTFKEHVERFWDDLLWFVTWVANGWVGKAVLALAALVALYVIATVVWDEYSRTPAQRARARRRRENSRRRADDRAIADENLRRRRQVEWERRERKRRVQGD